MATITKNPSGKFRVLIRVQTPEQRQSGEKAKPISRTFIKKADAKIWSRKTEIAITNGEYLSEKEQVKRKELNEVRLNVRTMLFKYMDESTVSKGKNAGKPRNWSDGEFATIKFWDDQIGDCVASEVTEIDIVKARQVLISGCSRLGKKRANSTINKMVVHLKNAYNFSGFSEVNNPAARVIRLCTADSGRVRVFRTGEEKKLIAACQASDEPALIDSVLFALYTTCRHGEVVQARFSDINFETNDYHLRGDTNKTNSSRVIPLIPDVMKLIKRRQKMYLSQEREDDLIFWNKQGESYASKLAKNLKFKMNAYYWEMARDEADMSDFNFHDLRHEATSRLVSAGYSLDQVGKITGHSSIEMTSKYSHYTDNENRITMSAINKPRKTLR